MKNKNKLFLQFCLSLFLLLPKVSSAQGIDITTGGSIAITGAATIEIENGDFINNGTYTKGTETVTMSGTTAKTMSGTTNTVLNNLIISNTGGITTQIGELTSNNLTVVSGGKFTVASGKAVNVTTALANNAGDGGFIVNSDANSNGSLITEGTSTGNVTYNRYASSTGWHLVSSPVGGQSIDASFMTANSIATNSGKYGLAPYNNSTAVWDYYTDPLPSATFTNGQGYEVLLSSTGTIAFTGTVPNNNVSIGITASASPGNSWNLVGNPFPSAIMGNIPADASNNFISVNIAALDDEYEAIYVWDAANSGYLTVNHSYSGNSAFYVAPGQSFFVYSPADGSTVNFTEAMQTHQTGNLFKSATIPTPEIKLIAERTAGSTSTHILYLENMSPGLDPGYDAGRFSAGNNSFAVYTHLVGDNTNLVDFDIQCLPSSEYDFIIPVGLNAPANTEVVFRAETMNLPSDVPVYLEDKVTATYTALYEPGSFYTVNFAAKTEGTGRFFLHTKSSLTSIRPIANENDFNIIPHPENNLIRVIGSFSNNSTIDVYDMAGRKMLNRKLSSSGINNVNMDELRSGIYVVFINSSTQSRSKKISWIRNN